MSPEDQFASFLAKYTPEMQTRTEAVLQRLRARLPGVIELVWDNYNALVVGFGPTERPSDATLSVAVFPRWVTLCFLRGAELDDPGHLLSGTAKLVRHTRLPTPDALDSPELGALIAQAVEQTTSWDPDRPGQMIVRSVSAKQRPRRPAEWAAAAPAA